MEVAFLVLLKSSSSGPTLAPGSNILNICLAFSLLVVTGTSVHPGVCQAALSGTQSLHIKGKASK